MTTREVVDIDSCEDDDDDDDDDENNKGGYQSHNNYYNENDDDDMRALHTFGTPIGGGGDGDDDHDGSMSSSSSSSYHRQYHSHESKRLNNSNSNDGDDHYYSSTSHDDDEDDRHHVVMTKTTDHRNYNHHNNDAVLLFENSSNDDDDDNNACHFTDDGWNTVRQRLDDQMEQTRLATLPPTPHQLQMAEELAKNSANKKQKDYINIKIKKPTLKKQSSKNNSRRGRQQDGGGGNGNNSSRKLGWSSGSDDDGILLNSPKGVIGGGGGDGSISSSSNKGGIRRKKLTLAKFRSTRSGMSSVSGVSTLGSGDERCPTEEGDNQTRNSLSASGTFINSLAQELKEKTKIGGSSVGGQSYRHDSQQQQWSMSGPPSNTVSVRCGRDSSSSTSSSFENSTTSTTRTAVMTIPPRHGHTVHSNMFRPLLLIQSNRRAHKGSIYVMKFSPHGGHFLATGGEDTRVCIWQVAPDVKTTTTSTTDNQDSEGNPTKGMRMDGGGSPERFVAGAREQEEAAEHAISQYRTTADSLADDNNTKQTPHFDKDILTHEGGSMPLGTDIHLLSKEPYVVFEGHHTAEIVDLAWSQQPPPFVRSSKKKKQKRRHEPFLLTASLDKMILLWHMSRPLAPLHKFAHADMVTCVDFHPTDDSLFVSGGFDSKLRLWSIADGRVKSYAQCPDIITSAKFTPDSNMIVAGLMKGQVFFYLSNSMTYYTQIDSKNRRGKNSEGCKVTGIEFFTSSTTSTTTTAAPTNSLQEQQQKQRQSPSSSPTTTTKKRKDYMLVTTNDSRLRIFDLDDAFRQIQKCKGLKNTQMQIKSHFCQSGQFIICGSETGSVYIWENEHEHEQQQRLKQNAGTTSKDNNNDSSGGGGGTLTFMSKLKVKKGGGAPTVGNILSSTSTAYASFDGCPRRRAVAVSQQQLLSGSGSSIPNVIGGGSIISGGGESSITGNGIATVIQQGAVTDAIFVPSESVLDSITKSELFSSTLQTCEQIIHRLPNEDFSSSMMVAGDNEGSLRIFLRRSCFDSIIRASGPAGSPHNR